jgi:hypothetical protein
MAEIKLTPRSAASDDLWSRYQHQRARTDECLHHLDRQLDEFEQAVKKLTNGHQPNGNGHANGHDTEEELDFPPK